MENRYSDEEIERCTLSSQSEIVFQIRDLIKRQSQLSVIFQEGQQSFLTILLDIFPHDGHFCFDVSGSAEVNQAFLNAESCSLSTSVDGINIRFSIKNFQKTTLNGAPAFIAPIPTRMIRLQRRDVFRLQLPSIRPFYCHIGKDGSEDTVHPLCDISVGGVGLLAKATDYELFDRLDNCWIDLRESDIIRCTLEVRHISEAKNRVDKQYWHVGCRFVDPSRTDEMLVQRFMTRIETERRLLSSA